MATLNGMEFQILEIEWATYQNNVVQDVIGSDTVVVHSQGYRTDPVRIRGRVQNEKELDDFQGEFYSGGVLTFIKDLNSDKQYSIYALGNIQRENADNERTGTGIIFNCLVKLKYPYAESVSTITHVKSITSQGQEWTQDDSGEDIKTRGNVNTPCDIKVIGSKAGSELSSNPVGEPSFETIAGWNYAEVDTNNKISGARVAGGVQGSYHYSIQVLVGSQVNDYGQISRTVDFTDIDQLSVMMWVSQGENKGDLEVYVDGNLLASFGDVTAYERLYIDTSAYTGSLVLIFRYVVSETDAAISVYLDDIRSYSHYTENISVYNTAEPTVKCEIANRILNTAIHQINVDGAGIIDYEDDFLTKKYLAAGEDIVGITYSSGELGLAGVGHMCWLFDAKYPISEIPVFTSKIYKFLGVPTIQISIDDTNWYDIKTAIVHDTETAYDLEATDLDLKKETLFYIRVRGEAGVAAIIKSMAIQIYTHTIYAKNMELTRGGVTNTLKCLQDSDGDDLCSVTLTFKEKWWV